MSIAIYTQNEKQSQKWKNVLSLNLPKDRIEIYPDIEDFHAITFLVCWKPKKGLLEKFPNLKAIQSLGAGVDHILDHHTIDPRIQLAKIVDDNLTHDMWEHSMSIIMSDMKNLSIHRAHQVEKLWKPKSYRRIKDISIGVLGLGTIGSYVARKFASLDFEVFGWSRTKKEINNVNSFIGDEGLNEVLSKADYVINILPSTKETKDLINNSFLSKMKKGAFFINVGRGAQVLESDLLNSLISGHLRGAALDVFKEEPLPKDNPLWDHPAVIITPHVASLTHIDSVWPQVVENYQSILIDRPMNNLVDIKKGY